MTEMEDATAITFLPWVGVDYHTKGLRGRRVLVVGESHYGEPGTEEEKVTQEVVERYALRHPMTFFTRTTKILLGLDAIDGLAQSQRDDLWRRIAFCNFVQSYLPGPRCRPTREQWSEGRAPFQGIVADLLPELVVVLGRELWHYMPIRETGPPLGFPTGRLGSGGPGSLAVGIRHPSAWGSPYHPAIEHLGMAFEWLNHGE